MIGTKSAFYYIESVSTDNFYLNFDEGGLELTAEVPSGDYTHESLAPAIADAMNEFTTLGTVSVSFDRVARAYTISSDNTLNLLVSSGSSVGSDIFSLIGFTGADRTGSMSYTGDAAGSEYLPQFALQSYVDEEDLRRSVQTSLNKSARGDIEVVTFGTEKFYEFELKWITNIEQGKLSVIETNLTGVEDARDFLRFATSKREMEFMADRNDRNTLTADILLESTTEARDGTGYRLKELYAQGFVGYYDSGKLVFKKVEF